MAKVSNTSAASASCPENTLKANSPSPEPNTLSLNSARTSRFKKDSSPKTTHTGAAVAIAFAANHPERVGSFVVQEVYSYSADENGSARLHRAHHYFPVQSDGAHLLEVWKRHGGDQPDADLYRIMEEVVEHLKINSDEGVQDLYGDTGWEGSAPYGMLRYDYWAALPRIRARTLVLHGSGSPLAVQHDRFVEGIPNATGMRPESPSLLNINTDPERFARILLDFLDAGG